MEEWYVVLTSHLLQLYSLHRFSWRSLGAPIDITPTHDDPALGADPTRNNDFRFAFPNDQTTQDRCPFAAHIRKTNPRADLEDLNPKATTNRRIVRAGIAFGREVSEAEKNLDKTLHGRGLLFAAYQSNIVNGFQFLQQSRSSPHNTLMTAY